MFFAAVEDSIDESNLDPPPSSGWRKQSPTQDTPPSSPGRPQDDESALEEPPLSLSDSDLMCGLLEVMVILWEVAKDRLGRPTHQKVNKNLLAKMAQSLPVLFNAFTVSL